MLILQISGRGLPVCSSPLMCCVFSPVSFSQNLVVSGATVGNLKDPGTSL